MAIGPMPPGAVLGALATLVAGGVPLYYRYVWGSKSHVKFSRLMTMEGSEWRDGRNEDHPIWSRRILIRVSNNGWRDGVITGVELSKVVLTGESGRTTITEPASGVHEIDLERFSRWGDEKTRLDLPQRNNYDGQIVRGRDDGLMTILPFLLQESELGKEMKVADAGKFEFSFTIEDNKRVYSSSVEVSTSLEDSAGGKLQSSG